MTPNRSNGDFLRRAWRARTVVPAFNIPYLPMMEPVVRALRDARSFGLITVARLEWLKFEARSLEAVAEEYERVRDPRSPRLHLDHVPVIDEDDRRGGLRRGDRPGDPGRLRFRHGRRLAAAAEREYLVHAGRSSSWPTARASRSRPSWAR